MTRKIVGCIIAMIGFLAVMTASAIFSHCLIPEFYGLVACGAGFVVCVIAGLFGRKHTSVMCVISVVAWLLTGLAFGTLFNYSSLEFDIPFMIIVAGGTFALYLIFLLYSLTGWMRSHPGWGTLAAQIVVIVALIALACVTEHRAAVYALIFYIPFLFMSIALVTHTTDLHGDITTIACCSLGALVIVAIVVLLVITEGDGDFLADGISLDSPAGKKQKPKK